MSDKIFVLREDVEYPDGANIVEIQGAGDERQIPRYPKISVAVEPLEVISNGIAVVLVTVDIRDYNSSNPFEGTTDVDGEGSAADNRFEFTTSGFIRISDGGIPLIRVWEDANREHEITDQIEKVEGSKVKLLDTFRSVYADGGNLADRGLIYQKVWYRMDTGPTVNLSVGVQEEGWWEKNPDGTSKVVDAESQDQVGGNFYYDAACTIIIPNNEVIAPYSSDQSTSIAVYFRPTLHSYGTGIINAAYSGASESTELVVTSDIASSITAELSAEPSSVQIGEKSLVTLYLSDRGKVLNDVNVNFFLLGDTATADKGYIEESVAVTQAQLNKEEFPQSTEGYKISLSHNIVRIVSIEQWPNLDPPGPGDPPVPPGDDYWWAFDPASYPPKIDGNTIELGTGNHLPLAEMNLKVVYDTGGYTSCVYVAPPSIPIVSGAKDPSITVALYALYEGVSKELDITVTPASSMKTNGLSINVQSPVAPGSTSLVKVWHNEGTDYDGREVSMFYWPEGYGSGPTSVTLGKKMIENEKQTLATPTRVSTEYPIDHTLLPVVTFYDVTANPPGDTAITVLSTSDTHDINLDPNDNLPAGLKVKITYRALAYTECYFTAPNQEMDVYINARLLTGIVEENVNATLEVSWSAANGINLSLDPKDSSTIPYEWEPDPQTDPVTPPVTRWWTDITVSSSYYNAEAATEALKTAKNRTVVLQMTPTGCGKLPGSIVLGSRTETESEIQPSSLTTINTKYVIEPGTTPTVKTMYNDQAYSVNTDADKTFGTQITIIGQFPITLPYCEITYTATAIATARYEGTGAYKAAVAAGSVTKDIENTDALLFLGGAMEIPGVGTGYGNCIITLNDPLANAGVEIECDPSTIYKERTAQKYENSEWRTDEEPVPQGEEDPNPKVSTLKVTVKLGGAIAPEGTPFTLYCFSQGKEPADDKNDGSVKTGGKVAGSTHTVGADGTWEQEIYARTKPVDTYTFKAVVGPNSADTSLTVEYMPDDNYLTYQIPVATIVGWILAEPLTYDPVTGNTYSRAGKEFISSNAEIINRGALKFADQYNGTDTFPEGENAADTSQDIMIKFDLPRWLDWQDCESFNISGARVLQPILEWGTGAGRISEDGAIKGLAVRHSPGIFGVTWNWEFNKKTYTFSPVEKFNTVDEKSVIGCKVTLGTSSDWSNNPGATWIDTTGQDGTVTFRGVYPGVYPIYLHSPNHKGNQDPTTIWGQGVLQSVGIFDDDPNNNTLEIPAMSMEDYLLKDTEWSIEVTATVKQRAKYDKLAAQTGWTPEKAENTRVNLAQNVGP